jgi:hypothetical protein
LLASFTEKYTAISDFANCSTAKGLVLIPYKHEKHKYLCARQPNQTGLSSLVTEFPVKERDVSGKGIATNTAF